MRKLLVLAVAATLAVVPAADAAKKGKKKHSVNLSSQVLSHSISQTLDAGSITDPVLGAGATVYQATGMSTSGSTTVQSITFTAWYRQGTISGKASVTLQAADAKGQIAFQGTGSVTSGSGRYKGAKGNLTFTGSIDAGTTAKPGSGDVTFSAVGKVTYTG